MTPEPPIEIAAVTEADPKKAYDVCNPNRLPVERLAFVENIHQQFLQSFAQQLAVYLDIPVEAIPAQVDQMPVAAFLEAAANDACVVTFDLAPMRGHAWAGLGGTLVFRILDILMGAPEGSEPAAKPGITEIEQHVLREFFQSLGASLDRAWTASGISLRLASIGTAADIRKTADPDGTALVLNCKIKIAEAEEIFRVAVPVLAIRLAALQNEQNAASKVSTQTAERTARLEAIAAAKLRVEAVLGGSAIRLGDLANMQAGQILVLNQPAGSQLECRINGKAKFRGEWIALGDRQGLQVEMVVEN